MSMAWNGLPARRPMVIHGSRWFAIAALLALAGCNSSHSLGDAGPSGADGSTSPHDAGPLPVLVDAGPPFTGAPRTCAQETPALETPWTSVGAFTGSLAGQWERCDGEYLIVRGGAFDGIDLDFDGAHAYLLARSASGALERRTDVDGVFTLDADDGGGLYNLGMNNVRGGNSFYPAISEDGNALGIQEAMGGFVTYVRVR